jgi:hypothetical protein
VNRLISITFMASKIIFCFVILLFTKRFLGRSLDVMISLFVQLCKSLGISIMFILLLLNEGEWCELWSMGGNTTTKGTWDLKLNILAGFVWIWCCRDCNICQTS